jgi:probable F420-dependent oxidoreductase
VKLDTSVGKDFTRVGEEAAALEAEGYDGIWLGETGHEPFMQCLQAVQATSNATIGTSIAIAFARTPMTMASIGYDLARYSQGRFVLGIGSQIKAHIVLRYSMPWSHPAPRMREFIQAMRAIWATWHDGVPLDFQGEFYKHILMTPFFSPERHEYGPPPVYLAGVGQLMTEVAGEAADGFFVHPFTTRRYLEDVTLPALQRGREKAGKPLDGFTVCGPSFITTGRTDEEMAAAIRGTKKQIAFYASTPAYRAVLEGHGWGEVQPALTRLSKQGEWDAMGELITDDMMNVFSVVGAPDEIGPMLREKLGDLVQRVSCYINFPIDPEVLSVVRDGLRG